MNQKQLLFNIFILLLIQKSVCLGSLEQNIWKSMPTNGSIFSDPDIPNAEISVGSGIQCASVANNINWPNVYHFDNGLCRLADANMTSCHNVVTEGSSLVVQGKWLHTSKLLAIQTVACNTPGVYIVFLPFLKILPFSTKFLKKIYQNCYLLCISMPIEYNKN